MGRFKAQAGLTLVELMVAMVLGLLLLAAIGQIFLSNKQTYRLLEAQSHAQENGRFSFEFMAKDIRMADFWGCQFSSANIKDHVCYSDPSHPNYDSGTCLSSGDYAYAWNSNGIEGTNNDGLNGSDTITLRGAFDSGIFVEQVPSTPSAALKVTEDSGITKGDLLVVTDCEKGEFFSVTGNTGSGGFDNIGHNTGSNNGKIENFTKVFQKKYGPEASVFKFGQITYNLQAGVDGEPALYKTYNNKSYELVTGVEDLQIEYGVDKDSNPAIPNVDYYVDAGSVTDWERVLTVRVTLTTRSTQQNVIIDAAGSSADNRLRRNFTSTMAVRNRLN